MIRHLGTMSEFWLRKAQRQIEQQAREQNVGGVQYFADEYTIVPGRTRSEEERAVAAEALYGPREQTLIQGQPRQEG